MIFAFARACCFSCINTSNWTFFLFPFRDGRSLRTVNGLAHRIVAIVHSRLLHPAPLLLPSHASAADGNLDGAACMHEPEPSVTCHGKIDGPATFWVVQVAGRQWLRRSVYEETSHEQASTVTTSS